MVYAPDEPQQASESQPLLPKLNGAAIPQRIRPDDIDSRWRRWKEKVTRGKQRAHDQPEWHISVFQGSEDLGKEHRAAVAEDNVRVSDVWLAQEVEGVKQAIRDGIHPQMIQTGSSGSYFAKRRDPITGRIRASGVFKPSDEEPYGHLNPKRAFLRQYFWWALGRPCLVPGFSAMSEAGASLLNDRLALGLVPKTQLVSLSSSAFHYSYQDRKAFEELGHALPEKIGSFQTFLHDYVMVSTFLRCNPFPSRPLSVFERDLAVEQRAHRKARNRKYSGLRNYGFKLKYLLLCRGDLKTRPRDEEGVTPEHLRQEEAEALFDGEETFLWTPELIRSFRLELEKLVILDYLLRNTDRGFDNFMVRHLQYPSESECTGRLALGAIDNSLAWPLKHPDGIRDYPYGWLYLPSEIIGGPFSPSTRDHFLPLLTSPQWWHTTVTQLRTLFEKDEHFQEKLFESQMAVFKGQGWNVVGSLQNLDEGPIELCARAKKVVHQSVSEVPERQVLDFEGGKIRLTESPRGGVRSRQELYGSTASSAKPIAIGGDPGPGNVNTADAFHPQSLPETSPLSLRDCDHREIGFANEAVLKGSHASSLGIEILEGLKRADRGHRCAFAKDLSGFDLGQKKQSPWSGLKTRSRSPTQINSYSETLSEADGEDVGSDEDDGEATLDAAMARMTQLDYLAQHQRHQKIRRNALQTIEFALSRALKQRGGTGIATSNAYTKRASRGAAASLRESLAHGGETSSEDVTAAKTNSRQTRKGHQELFAASAPPSRLFKSHRRLRSVGQWSVTSFGSRTFGDDGSGDNGHGRSSGERMVKVVVERLIDDRSLSWQAWLRA